MELTRETLGERLKSARVNVGLSQEEAAALLSVSRSIIAQIETGRRPISSTEMNDFARIYRRDVSELLSEDTLQEEDPLVVLGRITEGGDLLKSPTVLNILAQMREARRLAEYLDINPATMLPPCRFADPQSSKEAVEQGKEMASLERKRLDLGSSPIRNIAHLLAQQSLLAVAVPFPDEVSGLFVRHRKYGMTIFVNQSHKRERRRFSYAHEYAHALMDQDRPATPSSVENARELREKRANVFAAEFLVPEEGIREWLERQDKGGRSREITMLYSAASDAPGEPSESRRDPRASRITLLDIALLASEYQVSYDVIVYRLRNINLVTDAEMKTLLSDRDNGNYLMEFLARDKTQEQIEREESQPQLSSYLVVLAMEAYRLEKITAGRFREVCQMAQQPQEITDSLLTVIKSESEKA